MIKDNIITIWDVREQNNAASPIHDHMAWHQQQIPLCSVPKILIL